MADIAINVRLNDNGSYSRILEIQNILRSVEDKQHTINVGLNSSSLNNIRSAFDQFSNYVRNSTNTIFDATSFDRALSRLSDRISRVRGLMAEIYDPSLGDVFHQSADFDALLQRLADLENAYRRTQQAKDDFLNSPEGQQFQDALLREEYVNNLKKAFDSLNTSISTAFVGVGHLYSTLSSLTSLVQNLPGYSSIGNLFGNVSDTVLQDISNAIVSGVGGGFERYGTLQTFPQVLSAMGYANSLAVSTTNELRDSILGLPTALDDIVDSAQHFTILTGNLEKARDLAIALNNGFVASGASTEQINQSTRVFTYLLEGVKLRTTQWNTLIRSMPVLLKEVGKTMGYVDLPSFTKDLRQNNIELDTLIERIIDVGKNGEELNAILDVFKNTPQAALTNIKIAGQRLGEQLYSGLNSALMVSGQGSLVDLFNKIRDLIDEIGVSLNRAILANSDRIGGIVTSLLSIDWDSFVRGFVDGFVSKLELAVNTVETLNDKFGELMGYLLSFGDTLKYIFDTASKLFSTLGNYPTLLSGISQISGGIRDYISYASLARLSGIPIGLGLGTRGLTALATAGTVLSGVGAVIPIITGIASTLQFIWESENAILNEIKDENAAERAELDALRSTFMSSLVGEDVTTKANAYSNYVGGLTNYLSTQVFGSDSVINRIINEKGGTLRFAYSDVDGNLVTTPVYADYDLKNRALIDMSNGWFTEPVGGLNKPLSFEELFGLPSAYKDVQVSELVGHELITVDVHSVSELIKLLSSGLPSGAAKLVGADSSGGAQAALDALEDLPFALTESSIALINRLEDSKEDFSSFADAFPELADNALILLGGFLDGSVELNENELDSLSQVMDLISGTMPVLDNINSSIAEHETKLDQLKTALEAVWEDAIKNVPKWGDLRSTYESGGIPKPFAEETTVWGFGNNTLAAETANLTKWNDAQNKLFDQYDDELELRSKSGKYTDEELAVMTKVVEKRKQEIRDSELTQENYSALLKSLEDGELSRNVDELYANAVAQANKSGVKVEELYADLKTEEETIAELRASYDEISGNLQNLVSETFSQLFKDNPDLENDIKEFFTSIVDQYAPEKHMEEISHGVDYVLSWAKLFNMNIQNAINSVDWSHTITPKITVNQPTISGTTYVPGYGYIDNGVGFASGGSIPSFGTDTVPAMLTPGEYVHRRAVVQHYGKAFMDRINNLDLQGALATLSMSYVTPFATGGLVRSDNRSYRDNHASIVQNFNNSRSDYSFRRANRFVRGLS